MAFLKSLKAQLAGQEVEIIVKSIELKEKEFSAGQKKLPEMIKENRQNAAIIALDFDIRSQIDDYCLSNLFRNLSPNQLLTSLPPLIINPKLRNGSLMV